MLGKKPADLTNGYPQDNEIFHKRRERKVGGKNSLRGQRTAVNT